jgi:hypothetical protein
MVSLPVYLGYGLRFGTYDQIYVLLDSSGFFDVERSL